MENEIKVGDFRELEFVKKEENEMKEVSRFCCINLK
jgi:hypothetical protein